MQRHNHGRSLSRGALNFQSAAVHFGQVFREGQAEAVAAVGAEGVVPHLDEGLQDLWNILGSDDDPSIRCSEGDAASI